MEMNKKYIKTKEILDANKCTHLICANITFINYYRLKLSSNIHNATCCTLHTIKNNNWLNETAIDAGIEIVSKHLFPEKNIQYVPHYLFYQIQNDKKYDSYNHLFTKDNYENDITIVIHRPGHWYCAIISKSTSTIYILDLYYRTDEYPEIYKHILIWYNQLCDHLNVSYNSIRWIKKTFMNVPELPIQQDGTSCGVLIFTLLLYYIKNGFLPNKQDFHQNDQQKLRLYLATIIIDQKQNYVHRISDRLLNAINNNIINPNLIHQQELELDYYKNKQKNSYLNDLKIIQEKMINDVDHGNI